MKCILCSDISYATDLVSTLAKLCGKPQEEISIAAINEGYSVIKGDKRWVLENLTFISSHFSGELDFINLLALDQSDIFERIVAKDALIVLGGHTDFLMHSFKTSGLSAMLPRILEKVVYVGSSAGSMILGRRISAEIYEKIYDEVNDYGVDSYLEYVNYALLPHFDSPNFKNNRAAVLQAAAKNLHGAPRAERINRGHLQSLEMPSGFEISGIRDDCAIVIDGEERYIVGSELYQATPST